MPVSSCLRATQFVRRLHQAASPVARAQRLTVAIRREDASIWERRAPLAPYHVERLAKRGVRVLVQPSNRRAYPLQSYVRAGAEAREDISEAPVILGVKQVPVDQLLPGKTYCFFSHTIKAQRDNMPLLDSVLDKNIRLIDYERMVDEREQRVVAFGKYAGYAGMINILHGLGLRLLALGHHTPFMHIGPAHNYRNRGNAKQAIRDAGYEIALGKMPRSIGPLTFVFTGSGNVSQGAQEMFAELPVEYVDPADLREVAERGSTSKVYGTVVTRADHLVRKKSAPERADKSERVDFDEYNQHPDRYYSTFSSKIAPYASVIVNGVYWPPNAPRLLTIPDAKRLQQPVAPPQLATAQQQSIGSPCLPHRLVAICDISADPGGSIEFMQDCTTIDNPFCLYDAERNTNSEQSFAGDGILICSIDNMPTQLPLESTDMFGDLLFPYIMDIAASDASRPVDEESFSGVVQSAIIASNGALRPNYEYIQQLRQQQQQDSSAVSARASGAREVLVLGAGHVSGPLVEYLCRDARTHVTIVSNLESELSSHRRHAQTHNNLTTTIMDVGAHNKRDALDKLIGDADLVVSLLPYTMHPQVARMCIGRKTNLVTASYLSPEMRELDDAAKEAGVTIVNEIGLDPGIDHLLAKRVIDQVNASGGRITSFKSYCCGLPTPEFADNPLGYKFGWNPMGAFAITMNGARWKEDGETYVAEPGFLMDYARDVDGFLRGFALEAFPNRDSLSYQQLYNLPDARTIIRGTMRYRGFSQTINTLRMLGLMDREQQVPYLQPTNGSELTWRQLMAEMLGHSDSPSLSKLKSLIMDKCGKSNARLRSVLDLGLLDDEPVVKCGTLFDTTRMKIIKRFPFMAGENDLIIMRIMFTIEWPDRSVEDKCLSMVVYGESGSDNNNNHGFSAMAKTVGYPTAIASKMVLEGEIQAKGMVMPLQPEIYHPILKRLREEGIYARE